MIRSNTFCRNCGCMFNVGDKKIAYCPDCGTVYHHREIKRPKRGRPRKRNTETVNA